MTQIVCVSDPSRPVPDPELWMQYTTAAAPPSTVLHSVAGATVVVEAPAPRPRTCRLVLLYADEWASAFAEDAHLLGGQFRISEPGRPTHDLTYAVTGTVTRTLDTETASVWIIEAEITETTPPSRPAPGWAVAAFGITPFGR